MTGKSAEGAPCSSEGCGVSSESFFPAETCGNAHHWSGHGMPFRVPKGRLSGRLPDPEACMQGLCYHGNGVAMGELTLVFPVFSQPVVVLSLLSCGFILFSSFFRRIDNADLVMDKPHRPGLIPTDSCKTVAKVRILRSGRCSRLLDDWPILVLATSD